MNLATNKKIMITNLILAVILVAIAIGVTLTLDYLLPSLEYLFKRLLGLVKRSKLLTEYLLRAYLLVYL